MENVSIKKKSKGRSDIAIGKNSESEVSSILSVKKSNIFPWSPQFKILTIFYGCFLTM